MTNKDQLEQQYWQLQQGQQAIGDFEQWLYTTTNLEDTIGEDLYEALIILDYKAANIKSELRKLLAAHIDVDRFKREAFIAKLAVIIENKENTATCLQEMYAYYNQGYRFLEDLGMGLGFLVKILPVEFPVETYEELSAEEQQQYLARLHPVAKHLAKRVKEWIVNKKIILFQKEEFTAGPLQFQDFRTLAEKSSLIWEVQHEDDSQEVSYKRNRLLDEQGYLIREEAIGELLKR